MARQPHSTRPVISGHVPEGFAHNRAHDPRRLSRAFAVALIAGLATVGSLAAASTAQAASPDGTVTIAVAVLNLNIEDSPISVSGECPAAADHASVHYATGTHSGWYFVNIDPVTKAYSLEVDARYLGGPGETVTFTVDCNEGPASDSPVLATSEPVDQALPDFGAVLSMPTAIGLNEPISVSGTCGALPGVTSVIFYFTSGSEPVRAEVRTVTSAEFSFSDLPTPAQFGLIVDPSAVGYVTCTADGEDGSGQLQRFTSFAVTAPPVVIPPASAPVPALVETGTDPTIAVGIATILLAFGGAFGLAAVRRRQSS